MTPFIDGRIIKRFLLQTRNAASARIKNHITIGNADEDALEEQRWEHAVFILLWDILPNTHWGHELKASALRITVLDTLTNTQRFIDEKVVVKSGISFVSVDGARKNLAREIPGWDFEETRRKGVALWDDALSAIQIEGALESESKIFYTALYHSMIDPRVISDIDGNYVGGDGKIHTAAEYTPRTIFSGWDVYRGEFPLLTLLNATIVNDEINSLVNLAESTRKGYLERWEIMNSYSGCMDGDPATSVILDAYSKGITGFDIDQAYAAARQTAAGKNGSTNRPENSFYIEHGYVPDQPSSPGVSWTLDNAYFD